MVIAGMAAGLLILSLLLQTISQSPRSAAESVSDTQREQ
jgi:hypothetical protein